MTNKFKSSVSSNKHWIIFIVVGIISLIADLGTKHWAFNISGLKQNTNGTRDMMTVIPDWFDFTLAMNTGAAFSMFRGKFTFFMIISVVAFLTLIYFVHVCKKDSFFQPVILGLIFAGVAGNFWDRVVYEGVRDFISFHTPPDGFLFFSHYEYPTFNVADIWICVGAITMAFFFWKNEEDADNAIKDDPNGKTAAKTDENSEAKSTKASSEKETAKPGKTAKK
ncbi:MAG: signal peptidase II [Planctomycetota bacterium]|nr:signal peptidase II [Planctomycetota bacterium]